jgi:drug/metabolite transporter (DMT)-like permease
MSAFFGPVAYLSLIFATRSGDVAIVAPYRYSRLPFALLLGALLFDERPNTIMLVGCFLIVASGILILILSSRRS